MKQSKKLWGGRFSKPADKSVEEFTESISFDHRLYKQDIKGSIAHVKMLGKCAIISRKEAGMIINSLKKTETLIENKLRKGAFRPDSSFEDIHTYIEKKVIELAGDETGSKLHTARSRNDQVALDMKLYVKDDSFAVLSLLGEFCGTIIKLAEKYSHVIMPVYTHMQLARPVYFRDYIRAYLEMFSRDIKRIINCLKLLDYSPLGAGPVGGTHLPIDRRYTAKELGFAGIAANTIDAVSDRDFVIEYVFDLSMTAMHLSRLSEDLVLWMSSEFKFAGIDEAFMTGSSILPQKKNPDVCELARAKTGKLYGNLMCLLTIMKALPLSYNRDLQEDKPALFSSSDTVKTTLSVFNGMLKTLKLDEKKLLEALKGNYASSLLLVDKLVETGIGLRKAHRLAGKLIAYCEKNRIDFDSPELSGEDYGKLAQGLDSSLHSCLKNHFKAKTSDKAGLLARLFNKNLLKSISFSNYVFKGSRLGNSVKNDITGQLKTDRRALKQALMPAEKILKKRFFV